MSSKTVTIFVGANGAGKSFLARRILTPEQFKSHINPDAYGKEKYGLNIMTEEVAREITGYIKVYAEGGYDFSFETVGSSEIKRKLITELKDVFGYRLVFHYCHLDTDEQSIRRVTQRVRNGGHIVPIDKLIDRFPLVQMNVHYFKTIADEWHIWKGAV